MYTVKAKHNGKWIFGYAQFRKKTNDAVMWVENEDSLFTWLHIDKKTVCRPTGLTDKNGDLIFEGDYRIDENGNKEHVFYSKHQGAFVLDYSHLQDEDETYSELLSHDIDNFEIAGNIYD